MQVVPITERIYVEFNHITSSEFDIQTHINNLIKQKKGTCSKSLGYILDTGDILSIHDNTILRSSPHVVFNITYTATLLKPNIGDVYEAKIEEILPSRVRCKYKIINIMIPSIYLNGLSYNKDTKTFSNKLKSCIKEKDVVSVRIEKINYSSGNYLCIGKLINL